MSKHITFEERLVVKLTEQIKGRNVGFLLGAGASFLDGNGYPLTPELWPAIKSQMLFADQVQIDEQVAQGCSTLEQALDAIDQGRGEDCELRHRVTNAIAKTFSVRKPPLEYHRMFIKHLSTRNENRVPVFTLNYDPLLELAADQEEVGLIDGFCGTVECYFHPSCFVEYRGMLELRRSRSVAVRSRGVINLYKLHGSLGWYVNQNSKLKRIRPDMPCPDGWRYLMIPPQNRKAADTGSTPYAELWSELRAYLNNDSTRLLNRLICVGYGFSDGHVNAVINSALARRHFTLIIMAKVLTDEVFNRWSSHPKVLIITETRSSLYGELGPGIPDMWAFEWLAKEM